MAHITPREVSQTNIEYTVSNRMPVAVREYDDNKHKPKGCDASNDPIQRHG